MLCGPFAVEGIESRHFEFRWVFDCVPLYRVRSSGPRLLPDGRGLEGSDLLLKSLHPVDSVTISSLALRLHLALVVGLGVRLDSIFWFMRGMEADGTVRVRALLILAVAG